MVPCDPPLVEYDPVAEAAEEDFQGDVQARIDGMRDIDLADMVLDGDDLPGSVELAARRVLGALIRVALKKPRPDLSGNARELVDYVRETVGVEVRNG